MKAIPESNMPEQYSNNDFVNEPLISIRKYFGGEIICLPYYLNAGIRGATYECSVRSSVIKRLEAALNKLDSALTFKVYDAWRPLQVQCSLYETYYEDLKAKNPDWNSSRLAEETKKFVSFPSANILTPPVHNTGGAIDLTLCEKNTGTELNMGTTFDDFSPKAYTTYFEKETNSEIKENRRLLYWTMIECGFTNLPSEWWHYDYGDAFWGYYKGNPVKYFGVN